MRYSRISSVFSVLLSFAWMCLAQSAELPPDVQKITDKADAAIALIKKTSEEQISKIAFQELKDLQRLLEAAEKKKDTQRAQVIQKRIDMIKSAEIAIAVVVTSGQKIAFMGDSITEYGARDASGYVNEVISGLQANGITVTPVLAGISGHKSNDMLARLENDVLSKKPDWMTLSCVVNDVWHGKDGVPLDKYKENMSAILDRAKAAGVKVMILTATMIGEDAPNPNNQKLNEYNDFLRSVAKERGLLIADLNADMQAIIKESKASGNILTGDGVHMNAAGNRMMASGVLRAFGLTKAMLANAEAVWPGK